jgi:hypothetical protein
MTEILTRRRTMLWPGACVFALALLISGCASNNSGSNDLYDSSDSNNDNTLSREEWDQTFMNMDTNGDGAVTLDEYYAGGGRRH